MKHFIRLLSLLLLGCSTNTLLAQSNDLGSKKIVHKTFYPSSIESSTTGTLITFDKVYFGKLLLKLKATQKDTIYVTIGEKKTPNNTVDIHPPGAVRFLIDTLVIEKGDHEYEIKIPAFEPPAWAKNNNYYIPLPPEIGNIMPFRFVEIKGFTEKIDSTNLQQIGYFYPFNDSASACITSSDEINQIWDLCKHSIKATSFCGLYIDGDRERRPYEADAYINQMSHYAVDAEFSLARKTIDHLALFPTWPTEWLFHVPMMLWEDYKYTGNVTYIKKYYSHYATLIKALPTDNNGLILNEKNNDIIDWPQGERDGYQLGKINNVPNAFYYNSLVIQSQIAGVLGLTNDSLFFAKKAFKVKKAFNKAFWNEKKGLYIDAKDSLHSSIHANVFPIEFGLANKIKTTKVMPFIKSKGMAMSVYGAHYLLDMLYKVNEPDYAFQLLTARNNRSWMNMITQGTTITWEAWNADVKNNLDWNHAWGTAPANIIIRRIFGIRPLKSGFETATIEPQFNGLNQGSLKYPTIKGTIEITFAFKEENELQIQLKNNMPVQLLLPKNYTATTRIRINSKVIKPKFIHKQLTLFLEKGESSIVIKR